MIIQLLFFESSMGSQHKYIRLEGLKQTIDTQLHQFKNVCSYYKKTAKNQRNPQNNSIFLQLKKQ